MGSAKQPAVRTAADGELQIVRHTDDDKVIALAGNPNVGKSTVFNALTGMNQHTGNWAGKTVANAQGEYQLHGRRFVLVDLPGTYSLLANSLEEGVARDYLCFGHPDAVIVVADATCLERNLNLILQILEVTRKVVVCVNLMDEAAKKGIRVDLEALSQQLGVPVVGTSARANKGLDALAEEAYRLSAEQRPGSPMTLYYDEPIEQAAALLLPAAEALADGRVDARWMSLRLLDDDPSLHEALGAFLGADPMDDGAFAERLADAQALLGQAGFSAERLRDAIVTRIMRHAEMIYDRCVTLRNAEYHSTDRKIDRILTSRALGIPIMLAFLAVIFWLTIVGANYPSQALSALLFSLQDRLTDLFVQAGAPDWLHGMLVLGVYRTLAWVVSVMLPPMTIFFPLFTLLEDAGYLPRVAFNLDHLFKKAHAHGKQSLTMCMGFGCNACGVTGCRIIESPRERLIAMLTNAFVPCNGRFPTLIAIITMFFTGLVVAPLRSTVSTLLLTGVVLLGVGMTLALSSVLSKTILKGLPSSFALELPPYRRPQIGRVIVRSIFDRTLFVLGRALTVAAPAGLLIWLLSNLYIGDASLLAHCTAFLDPAGRLIGLDGAILMAFILGFPANEIVVPIIIMSYMNMGQLTELPDLAALRTLFLDNGWTWVTALCTLLFSLLHFPCATTCLTIRKEAGGWKWAALAMALPTAAGVVVCFLVASGTRLLGLV